MFILLEWRKRPLYGCFTSLRSVIQTTVSKAFISTWDASTQEKATANTDMMLYNCCQKSRQHHNAQIPALVFFCRMQTLTSLRNSNRDFYKHPRNPLLFYPWHAHRSPVNWGFFSLPRNFWQSSRCSIICARSIRKLGGLTIITLHQNFEWNVCWTRK